MTLLSQPRERYLGGFFVDQDDVHDAVHRGRPVRYVVALDSYADAVAWRRLMAEEDNVILPLSQAAGEGAGKLREAFARADAAAAREAAKAAEAAMEAEEQEPPPIEPSPFELALGHIHALLARAPSYTDYDAYFVAVEKCAHCQAPLSDDAATHADGCVWQAARRFLLTQALDRQTMAA
jgi:hypothetical protein